MKQSALVIGALGLVLVLLSFVPALQARAPTSDASGETHTTLVARGRALFLVKGCAQCHGYHDIGDSGKFDSSYGVEGAPNLSTNRWTDAYLRDWLHNPAAVKPGTTMPNLNLKPEEIDALIAFLGVNAQQ